MDLLDDEVSAPLEGASNVVTDLIHRISSVTFEFGWVWLGENVLDLTCTMFALEDDKVTNLKDNGLYFVDVELHASRQRA